MIGRLLAPGFFVAAALLKLRCAPITGRQDNQGKGAGRAADSARQRLRARRITLKRAGIPR